jgi:hypothetical protein
LIVDCVRY